MRIMSREGSGKNKENQQNIWDTIIASRSSNDNLDKFHDVVDESNKGAAEIDNLFIQKGQEANINKSVAQLNINSVNSGTPNKGNKANIKESGPLDEHKKKTGDISSIEQEVEQ